MATTSAHAPIRMTNHTGVAAPPVAGSGPETARAIGPATAKASSPASSSRTIPNRSPSSRRASSANPPTTPTTLSTIRTPVRAMARSLIGEVALAEARPAGRRPRRRRAGRREP